MSLLRPLHPGPEKTVRVLADAGAINATARRTSRAAAVAGFPLAVGQRVVIHVGERDSLLANGTCTPLPFHVTGGQPAVGQGVVVSDWCRFESS
ncbi:unnamed protein product [Spirodela intermedia]|uniref:Uncharacterized protein n=1 Tax=Spirodela intermedia TaxID=51605 RepID=A0A7I8L6V0_SPIIN|nr:unnamed protein product [Spirodela intermedia]